jgi:hypothetical protein
MIIAAINNATTASPFLLDRLISVFVLLSNDRLPRSQMSSGYLLDSEDF